MEKKLPTKILGPQSVTYIISAPISKQNSAKALMKCLQLSTGIKRHRLNLICEVTIIKLINVLSCFEYCHKKFNFRVFVMKPKSIDNILRVMLMQKSEQTLSIFTTEVKYK